MQRKINQTTSLILMLAMLFMVECGKITEKILNADDSPNSSVQPVAVPQT
jgi:hypothetical protein